MVSLFNAEQVSFAFMGGFAIAEVLLPFEVFAGVDSEHITPEE